MGYVKGKSKNLMIVKKIIIDTNTVLISLIIFFVNNCNHYNSINVIIEHRDGLCIVLYISIFNYNNNIIIIELLKLL